MLLIMSLGSARLWFWSTDCYGSEKGVSKSGLLVVGSAVSDDRRFLANLLEVDERAGRSYSDETMFQSDLRC